MQEERSPQAQRWLRLAVLAWVVFSAALVVKILAQGLDHSLYGDFVIGPRRWWAGLPMYDTLAYYYSPTFAVLFTPFAILPDWLGQTLWGLLSVWLLVWGLRVFYRDVLCWSSAFRLFRQGVAGSASSAEPIFLTLVLAASARGIWSLQSNAILMAGMLLGAAAVVRRQWWRAAFLLAAPVHIKLWPIVAGGLLSVLWPKKMIGRFAIACTALAIIPFLTKAPSEVISYYRSWTQRLIDRQATAQRFTGYRDAWTIWEQIHSPVDKQAYFVMTAAAGLAVLGWSLWLRHSRRTDCSDAEIVTYTLAAWASWQLLFGPGTERLTYLIIAPFAAWAVITSFLEHRHQWLGAAAFVTTFFLGAGFAERILVRIAPAAIALQPVGVILLAAWLTLHVASDKSWKKTATGTETPLENPGSRLAA
jgi:hypothetical protein